MNRRWTAREAARICRLRAKNVDTATIVAAFPHRTRDATETRIKYLRNLGLFESQRLPWTPEEETLLCDLRGRGLGSRDLAKHFPNRTVDAIERQISVLIRAGRIERLRAQNANYRPWSAREESVLISMRAQDATLDKIQRRLPKRSRSAIVQHIQELMEAELIEPTARAPRSRQRWSPEEDQLVAEMRRARRTVEEIAAALRRSVPSVANRIARRARNGEIDAAGAEFDDAPGGSAP